MRQGQEKYGPFY